MASHVDVELEASFEAATKFVQATAGELDSKLLLQLYGLFKRATAGPCTTAQPSWFQATAKQKWDAWNKVTDLPEAEAKLRYIQLLTSAHPEWRDSDLPSGWVSVSCPVAEEEEQLADKDKTLLDWAKEGRADLVRKLVANGHDPNQWDDTGMTALHWATDRGNLEVVKCLLSLGAEFDFKDADGQTALHYAASCGHVEVVDALLKAGADPAAKDNEGDTPVDVACGPDVAQVLTMYRM
ncbi:uncharacterized protein LOC132193653 [Neocloeon triangulifer]|uniref:uncharacterized protein LOC132193653 n=1 Tax=Neocloeon triangulifer TaxID=2078957 RepID=UPI00286F6C28|nr:uncharacterized protein LOC132193653 [Neocloeon triangulifer]